MFNLIVQKGITPNQFYLLYSIRENVATLNINIHQELRFLVTDGWLKEIKHEKGSSYKLEAQAVTLIQQVESFFKIQKKKTSTQLMGSSYSDNLIKYLEIFPRVKLPSGSAARSDKKNVETAMRWFFDNYEYTWETVLGATINYVDEYEKKSPAYMYMQTAQYFIRKQQTDKTWGSELANRCAAFESGDDVEEIPFFPEKVV